MRSAAAHLIGLHRAFHKPHRPRLNGATVAADFRQRPDACVNLMARRITAHGCAQRQRRHCKEEASGAVERGMTWNLMIDADCIPVTLHAGARVHCGAGRLWMTVEERRAIASPDIVLAAGKSHRVTRDGTYFLSALRGTGSVLCQITPAPSQRLVLRLT